MRAEVDSAPASVGSRRVVSVRRQQAIIRRVRPQLGRLGTGSAAISVRSLGIESAQKSVDTARTGQAAVLAAGDGPSAHMISTINVSASASKRSSTTG